MKHVAQAVLVLIALVLMAGFLNFLVGRPSGTTLGLLGAKTPQLAPVVPLLEHKCANCHTTDVKRPLYSYLPFLGRYVERRAQDGMREFDFACELLRCESTPIAEAALAKLEYVIDRHTMPPGDYRSMHWDAHLDDGDRRALLGWIRDLRRRHYAPAGLPSVVQEHALHPLPGIELGLDPRAVALGERLYHDARLSADGSVSCSSCHDLARAGCDGERFSRGAHGERGELNAPTTFNAGFHRALGWDGGAETLEGLVTTMPPPSESAPNPGWEAIRARLAEDDGMRREFVAIHPEGVSLPNIVQALVTFQRTLVTPGARFDRYLLGETAALTLEEERGYRNFLQWGCQTCHVGKALGGQSFERLGRRADYFGERGGKHESDAGRFAVTGNEADRHRFKVPSLRNVARTAPYLHDGSVVELQEAVRVMLRYQVGIEPEDAEVKATAAFLASLTGEYRGRPL